MIRRLGLPKAGDNTKTNVTCDVLGVIFSDGPFHGPKSGVVDNRNQEMFP